MRYISHRFGCIDCTRYCTISITVTTRSKSQSSTSTIEQVRCLSNTIAWLDSFDLVLVYRRKNVDDRGSFTPFFFGQYGLFSRFRLYERDPFTNKPIKSRPMPEGTELTLPTLSATTTTTLLMPGPATNTTFNTLHPHSNGCASLIFPHQSMSHTVSCSSRSFPLRSTSFFLSIDNDSPDGESFSTSTADLFLSFIAQRQCLVNEYAFRPDLEYLFQRHQSSIATTRILLHHSGDDDSSFCITTYPTSIESVSSIGASSQSHRRKPSNHSIKELTDLLDFLANDQFTASQHEYVGSQRCAAESFAHQISQSEVIQQWYCRALHWWLCHSWE